MDMKFQKKIGNYMLQKLIGSGSFAKVYKGVDTRTNEPVAIKMISKENLDPSKLSTIEKEINILRLLQHPNIILIKDIKRTQNNIYLILEYCHLGDLENYIEKFYYDKALRLYHMPEAVVQKIVSQLSEGFKLMRERNIVHRDLKLANILVSKDFVIKLADFGFAKFQENSTMLLESYCGTPITMAPEILKKHAYNEKCDIWSLGIIIYKMLVGKYPFFPSGNTIEDLMGVVDKGILQFPANLTISQEVKGLIGSMLVKDPMKRMGFEEFFKNNWVVGGVQGVEKTSQLDLKDALASVYQSKMSKNSTKETTKDSNNKDPLIIQKSPKVENNAMESIAINETNKPSNELVIKVEENKNNMIDIERLSLDSSPKDRNTQINPQVIEQIKKRSIIDQITNFFIDKTQQFIHKINEINSIIVQLKDQDSQYFKLLAFLLTLTITNELKSILSSDIAIFINNTDKIEKNLLIFFKNQEDLIKDLRSAFKSFYKNLCEMSANFDEISDQTPRTLIYNVFLEIVEQSIVNEYLLDVKSLKDSYKKLIEIDRFLKQEQYIQKFNIYFSALIEKLKESLRNMKDDDIDEDIDIDIIEGKDLYSKEYEDLERLFNARINHFEEIQ